MDNIVRKQIDIVPSVEYNTISIFMRITHMNEYITIKEAAEKWDISIRRINTLCNEGRIPGSVKFGVNWAIPVEAEKPIDMRIKSGRYVKNNHNE